MESGKGSYWQNYCSEDWGCWKPKDKWRDAKYITTVKTYDRLPINLNSFALSSGIPPQVVMKWTGHSDYQAMKPYIAIAEKTKADAMKLFDEELKK